MTIGSLTLVGGIASYTSSGIYGLLPRYGRALLFLRKRSAESANMDMEDPEYGT